MIEHRLSAWLAWGQLLVVLLTAGAGVGLRLAGSGFTSGVLPVLPFVLLGLSASGVGALIVARRPENAIGRLLVVVGLSSALALGAGGAVDYLRSTGEPGPLADTMAWLAGVSEPVAFHVIGPFLFLFPDGRLPSRRWRWMRAAGIATALVSLLAAAFVPWPLRSYQRSAVVPSGIENPLALSGRWETVVSEVQDSAFLLLQITLVAATLSLVFRYRAAGRVERQRIKWIASSGGLIVLAVLTGNVLDIRGISRWSDEGSVPVLITLIAAATIPLTTGIAILRYQLYDIDRIISRTLAYAVLTVGLGAIYVGLVVGLQALLRPVSGGSDLAIVVTTLVVAALFLPARHRIQRAVDRHFNRRTYDAARTIEAFSTRLREQVDLDTLERELVAIVEQTMQPARASIWIRHQGNDR